MTTTISVDVSAGSCAAAIAAVDLGAMVAAIVAMNPGKLTAAQVEIQIVDCVYSNGVAHLTFNIIVKHLDDAGAVVVRELPTAYQAFLSTVLTRYKCHANLIRV